MIYLVTKNSTLFSSEDYSIISVEESLEMLNKVNRVQFDTETDGLDAHINKLLSAQFGITDQDIQIVVDCLTIDIKEYKNILSTKLIIGQNLKFDIKFLYSHNIIPSKVYDTMIVEQFLYLGYPPEEKKYSLAALCREYLGIELDKTIRGQIIWRGLDSKVIKYAAYDVKYMEQIMLLQIEKLKKNDGVIGAKIECDFVRVIAYLEWCGIKLDEDKWKSKMQSDKNKFNDAVTALNNFIIQNHKEYTKIETQGSLFDGFDLSPKVTINWSSSQQVVELCKKLGFNTSIQDKKTGETKDSVLEKSLSIQKGINDEFIDLYFKYKEAEKLCSSFGQGHLNAINPITGRLHTEFKQLGTTSGRMSCGGSINNSVAAYKHISPKSCPNVNLQQLPHDAITRACFVAEKGNLFCSCDYSAEEARIGAMVYNEKTLIDEFLYGSGDSHAAYAKAAFPEELKNIPTSEVKKKRPDLRSKVKSLEFALQFGSNGSAAAAALGVSQEEAIQFASKLLENMKGLSNFKKTSSAAVRKNGYITVMPQTGHRVYWWDFKEWKEIEESFTPEFWEDYKSNHKGTNDSIAKMVRTHFKAASKWDRLALNCPTQGGGAVILKTACVDLFKWIIDNGLFNKVKLCVLVHDEINVEFPEELKDTFPSVLSSIMEKAAAKYYSLIPIPAEPEVATCWKH